MLNDIEVMYAIKFPKLFWRLFDEEMLDWGKQGPDWYRQEYPRLRKKPPFLLFANDFKLIPPDQMSEQVRLFATTNYCLIPFGKNGAGELFGFSYDSKKNLNFICRFNKITGVAFVIAKDLEDFLFRQMLGSVVDINQEELDGVNIFFEDLIAMLNSHKSYLNETRIKILDEAYHRSVVEFDEDEFGCLSADDYVVILQKEIDFPKMHHKIPME